MRFTEAAAAVTTSSPSSSPSEVARSASTCARSHPAQPWPPKGAASRSSTALNVPPKLVVLPVDMDVTSLRLAMDAWPACSVSTVLNAPRSSLDQSKRARAVSFPWVERWNQLRLARGARVAAAVAFGRRLRSVRRSVRRRPGRTSLRSRAVAPQCVSPLAEAVVPRTTSCVPRAQEADRPALSFHPRDHR